MARFSQILRLTGLILIPCIPGLLYPQSRNALFEHLSEDDGLSNANVMQVLQDSRGFLWIATRHGLDRYDGYEFTVYEHDPDSPRSLSHNDLTTLYEDRQGTLWIGTWLAGLNRYDRENETFERLQHDPSDSTTISHDDVRCIYEDSEGMFWIGTRGGGLNLFDRANGVFRHFRHETDNPQSISSDFVYAIYEDHEGALWIGTMDGLDRFDRTSNCFLHYRHARQDPQSLSNNVVTALYGDRQAVLWVGTMDGLNRYDRKGNTFRHYKHDPQKPSSLSHNQVTAIHEDRQGVLWIGTTEGLNRYDRDNDCFRRFGHDPQDPRTIGSDDIRDIYEDRSGILWVGCGKAGGLNKYDRSGDYFRLFELDPRDPRSLIEGNVWAILEDASEALWIAGKRGVNRFDRENETFRYYEPDPQNPLALKFSDTPVVSICEGKGGVLWIGMVDGGLNYFDRKTGTFRYYKTNFQTEGSLSHATVTALYTDRDGILWLGVYGGGLYRFDPEKGDFRQYKHDPEDPTTLSHYDVRCIYEDREGRLWVGTNGGGLNLFDGKSETFRRYEHDPRDSTSLSNNFINVIHEDHAGTLWLGTYGGGLNRFDRATETFVRYGVKEGLAHETVSGILEDGDGNLWLSTFSGISKFNPKDNTFKNYEVRDGLHTAAFLAGAYCRSRGGEMFFGADNGFYVFHPDSLKDNPYVPPVVITAFARYNTHDRKGIPLVEKGISEKRHLELSYDNNILSFEFAALDYRSTSRNRYAYKLEGFAESWIQLGTERRVTFTNLDPGDYTLRVKASPDDGDWNGQGASLRFTVRSPWWSSWWAYVLYTASVLGLLYGIRRYELNRQRLKHGLELEHVEAEKLQQLDRLKSRFFANVSHEFRTPLTLIRGPVQQLLSGEFNGDVKEQYRLMLRNTERLLRLVNQLLDISRLESGKMHLHARRENAVELTRQLTMALESLAGVKGIELRFAGPEEPVFVYLEREHYEKIITNLIFNALKSTPSGGRIEVSMTPGLSTAEPGDRGIGEEMTGSEPPFDRFSDSRIYPSSGGNRYVEIIVRDTGRGIPTEHLPHIFDRFYQAGETDTPGSGIGLALTRELVELHHGKIQVSSDVGKGTEFAILLPLGKGHLAPEEIVDDSPPREAGYDGNGTVPILVEETVEENGGLLPHEKRPSSKDATIVMIVEDNADMRAYIRHLLVGSYQVVEAPDGNVGLEKAADIIPDIIISDVMMPGMDGYQFCERIKTEEHTSHIPVILLTARSSGESKVHGLETGADDYLVKPFDPVELKVRVKNLIEQRRRLRQRFRQEITLEPQKIAITSADARFLQRIMDTVERNIEAPQFGVTGLSSEVGMSRSQLHRKLRALTDQSPVEFIRTIKLKRAASLLRHHAGNISEVAYQTGFSNPAYFSECFRKAFGVSPKEYAARSEN